MARAKSKNLTAAIRAPFQPSQTVTDQVKGGFDLTETEGFYRRVTSADGTHEIPFIGVGTDDLIRLGQEGIKPQGQAVTFTIAANAAIGTTAFFIADRTYYIQGVTYSHKTLVTGTLTAVSVTHDTGTQAAGAGTSITTAAFDPTAANATDQNGTLNGEVNYSGDPVLFVNIGDRLSFKLGAGTLTAYAGVTVTVYLTPGCTSEVAQYYVHRNADLSTQTFFTATRDMVVTGVQFFVGTLFAAAVTGNITKDTSTTAAGGGTSILSGGTALKLDGTGSIKANTVYSAALTATAATLKLAAGDSLAISYSATTTGADILVVVSFAPIFKLKMVTWQLGPNAQQQVAQNWWTADRDYILWDAACKFGVAAGGAATVKITIDKGTTAAGGGNATDASGFDLNATANTVEFLAPAANRLLQISAGDRLGLAVSGAAQAIANVCVTAALQARS